MRKLRYVGSVMGEIFQFARQHKVYWIVPFVLILALVIVLVVTSQAAALRALLLGEAALRLAGISYPNFYRPDPDRGWALRPGAEGWWRQEGLAYVRVSSAGLRDVEHPIPKPAGRLRIAVLGDSCAEALQVPVGQTFWKLLERRLPGCPAVAGRAVEALDFGVAGYGTAQELLTLRRGVGRSRPAGGLPALYP